MQKVLVKVTYLETGRTIDLLADTCTVDVEPGMTKASWEGLIHYLPSNYQTVTIHATAIITRVNPAYISQPIKSSEPYLEIW